MQSRATEENEKLFVLYAYHRSLIPSEVRFL